MWLPQRPGERRLLWQFHSEHALSVSRSLKMASAFIVISKCSIIGRRLPATCRVLVCGVFIVILASLLRSPGAIRSAGTITEYPIPTATAGRPTEITAGSDGNLWFLESTAP